MSLEIKNFYKNVNKIKYKDYVIDNNFNLNLLFLLKDICILSQEYNLDFKLTGAWAFVFKTNRIYRTISDIDLIILRKDFKNWIRALDRNYGLLYEDNPKEFVKKTLQNNPPIFRFKHKNDENKTIDIIIRNEFSILPNKFSYSEYEEISLFGFKIIYRLPYKFLKPNQGFEYGRDIDSDDVEFYKKVIAI
jgi:hypothetical protein